MLGVVLAVFQQWCGINVIFNYAEEIFAAAGYGVSDILFNIVITGVVNLVFTFVAIGAVDRVGRRFLMLAGSAGLAADLRADRALRTPRAARARTCCCWCVAAIACYGCTLAPVTWVVLSEIFPNRVRGTAMALAVFALWAACFILTYHLPVPEPATRLGGHLLALRGDLRAGVRVHPPPPARDQGQDPGGDRGPASTSRSASNMNGR